MRIEEKLLETVKAFPEKVVLSDAINEMSYQRLLKKAILIADIFNKKLAIPSGSPIAIALPNSCEFIIAVLAIWLTKNVVVPINPLNTEDEIDRIREKLGIRMIISNSNWLGRLRDKPDTIFIELKKELEIEIYENKCGSDEPNIKSLFSEKHAVIFLTSGTTGIPKIVGLTHGNLLSNLDSEKVCLPISHRLNTYVHLPMYHSYIFTLQVLATLLSGGHLYIGGPNKLSVDLVREMYYSKCTSTFLVPAAFRMILDGMRRMPSYERLKSLEFFVNGASSMTNDILKNIRSTFSSSDIYLTYGLSEASPLITCLDPSWVEKKGCSIGKVVPNVKLELLQENGAFTHEENDVGEIIIKGKSVIESYINNDELNKKAFIKGYLKTGDIAKIDRDGCLYLCGRLKEIINRGGEKIYPNEIEIILSRYNKVLEASVIPCPHSILGEVPYAFIKIKGSEKKFNMPFLRSLCDKYLPAYKRPVSIKIIDEFPKTSTGKIIKNELSQFLEF